MPSIQKQPSPIDAVTPALGLFAPAIGYMDYMVDATQRSFLFWEVMRQRGNRYREHLSKTAPHVLDYRSGADRRRAYARAAGQLCSS